MSAEHVRVSASWLGLREPADAAARSRLLVQRLAPRLTTQGVLVVHDLGCGSGSMSRWLSPLLPGRQHWVQLDDDADLLALAADGPPLAAADGAAVTREQSRRDLTGLGAGELSGAGLVTASALLDMLDAEQLRRLVASCAAAGCPALLTLSVTGEVHLDPAEPLDACVREAFNAHQRRVRAGRQLLGPDAAATAAGALRDLGLEVVAGPSPWQLGPADRELTAVWFRGWVGAACEQEPALLDRVGPYAARRLAQAAAGELVVRVHHQDLLALPR